MLVDGADHRIRHSFDSRGGLALGAERTRHTILSHGDDQISSDGAAVAAVGEDRDPDAGLELSPEGVELVVDEEARGGATMLPINFLKQLIGLYGNSMQNFVPFEAICATSYLPGCQTPVVVVPALLIVSVPFTA